MNQLRLTQKFQKAAGIKSADLSEIDDNGVGLGSWTVNLFNQDRKKVIVFVNDKTLYSFILTGARKEHFLKLPEIFANGLCQLLSLDGFGESEIAFLSSGSEKLTYSKTNSKKVLGNMNDLIWHYQFLISDSGGLEYANINEIIYKLNRMPQRNIGWSYSIEAVKEVAKNA